MAAESWLGGRLGERSESYIKVASESAPESYIKVASESYIKIASESKVASELAGRRMAPAKL